MADNPNPDHLRGWGAPIPDRLTPEERETLEDCRRRPGFGIPSVLFQAFDRLAPKPAAEPIRGTFSVSARSASRYRLGKDIGEVYVQSSIDRPIEVTFRSTDDTPTPDPDREAREAVTALCDDPHWFGGGTSQRLETIRAHGFAHRSEMNNGHEPPAPPPAAGDVVREALEWAGTNPIRPGYTTVVSDGASTRIVANETLAQYVERGAAALAARGVTFGGKA